MREKILKQYQIMAAKMNALETDRGGEPRYHFMADALYWTDEIPSELDEFSEDCLRLVLRYRTSLIQGCPAEKWREYWEEAKRQFPSWIGFTENRCQGDARILENYITAKADANKDLPSIT